MSIPIEQKYGKYLFNKKIKAKKLISKQVSIITKEEIKSKTSICYSDCKEKEDNKAIHILHSIQDSFSNDKSCIEDLPFFPDIKSTDQNFAFHLKEEIPKLRPGSIKYNILCGTLINSNNSNNSNEIKNNCFINTITCNNKENNEDSDNEEKNNEENFDDEVDEYIKKRKQIIIKSLIYFNKDNTEININHFSKRIPDLNKTLSEDDNKFEKNIYIKIEDRIRECLNKYKSGKLGKLLCVDKNYIGKIINFQKKSNLYSYICFKAIIIALINIINEWVGKECLKILESNDSDSSESGISMFMDIFEKFQVLKEICEFLEKDFDLFIKEFKSEKKIEFKFIDVVTDIYWDYVFRIKQVNINFTDDYYKTETISHKAKEIMDNVIDLLIIIEIPYKKYIGEILDITCIKKEKNYLLCYIEKYKNNIANKNNKNNTNNSISNNFNINSNNTNIDSINQNSINTHNIFSKMIKENIDILNDNNDINENNSTPSEEKTNINTSGSNTNNNMNEESLNSSFESKKLDLNLAKSLSMDNKLEKKDSLEDIYNYILNGDNDIDKTKKKKRHRKKRKNKKNKNNKINQNNQNNNNNSVIEENEICNDGVDPVVEEFKNYLINLNDNEKINKIKPKIRDDWINSISISVI